MNTYTVKNINGFSKDRKEVKNLDMFSILHPLNNRHGIVYGEHVFDCMLRMYMYIRMYAINDNEIDVIRYGAKIRCRRDYVIKSIYNMPFDILMTDGMDLIYRTWLGDEIEFEIMRAVCLYKIMQHEDVHFELTKDIYYIYVMDGDSKKLMSSNGIVRDNGEIDIVGENMFGFAMMKAFDLINGNPLEVKLKHLYKPIHIELKCDKRFSPVISFCSEIIIESMLDVIPNKRVVVSNYDDDFVDIYITVSIGEDDRIRLGNILLELPTVKRIDFME